MSKQAWEETKYTEFRNLLAQDWRSYALAFDAKTHLRMATLLHELDMRRDPELLRALVADAAMVYVYFDRLRHLTARELRDAIIQESRGLATWGTSPSDRPT